MEFQALERQRHRTLYVALLFHFLLALGGAFATYHLPVRGDLEWGIYLLSSTACLLIGWRAWLAQRAGQQKVLERWALVLVLLGAALILQRMAFALFGPLLQEQALSPFRPVFAYWPFIYLAAFLLLPSKKAMWISWSLGGAVAVMTAVGLQLMPVGAMHRADKLALLLWVMVGNPLFLLMLRSLPRYEDWLKLASSEVSELRERTQLLDRISASEQRFNLVMDSLQVGVWDQRFEQGKLVERWWSPRYYELLGYTPEDLPPSAESMVRLLGEGEAERIHNQLYGQLRDHNQGVTATDARMLTKDRGWRWFNIACKAQFDDAGQLVRVTGAIEDIHLRRVAEIELLAAQEELISLAYRDALTNLPNRRAFDDQLKREWERARRNGKPLSLLSLDIDWFKGYNDYYGHPAGDECLRRVADVITECVRRPGDFSGRVGGEEFLILMPETDAAGAMKVAKMMEAALRKRALPHHNSPLKVVTFSIGITTEVVTVQSDLNELLSRADQALYESKRGGRNRITAA